MEKTHGLTPNQEKLLSILEYKGYKTILRDDLLNLISKHKISKNPRYLIKSMLLKKRLIFFKRKHYIIIPMKSVNKEAGIDEFELNELFLESKDYYIGMYNAFNLHHFTEQIPNKLFVFNTKYSIDRNILHYKFKYFKIKKDKLFGVLKKYKYPYSNRERTIIDVLDYPEYFGGLSKIIPELKDYNKERLDDYAIKYNSVKIMKIIGYLTDSQKIYRILKNKGKLNYYTTVKKTRLNIINKKWKIRMI